MANIKEASVVRMINRILRPMGEVLRNAYDHESHNQLGNHYITEANTGKWIQTHVDLKALAVELDVLDEEDEVVDD